MADTKTCPFCAEVIQVAAIKCKHCGERLDHAQKLPRAPQPPHPAKVPIASRRAVIAFYIAAIPILGWLCAVLIGGAVRNEGSGVASIGRMLVVGLLGGAVIGVPLAGLPGAAFTHMFVHAVRQKGSLIFIVASVIFQTGLLVAGTKLVADAAVDRNEWPTFMVVVACAVAAALSVLSAVAATTWTAATSDQGGERVPVRTRTALLLSYVSALPFLTWTCTVVISAASRRSYNSFMSFPEAVGLGFGVSVVLGLLFVGVPALGFAVMFEHAARRRHLVLFVVLTFFAQAALLLAAAAISAAVFGAERWVSAGVVCACSLGAMFAMVGGFFGTRWGRLSPSPGTADLPPRASPLPENLA